MSRARLNPTSPAPAGGSTGPHRLDLRPLFAPRSIAVVGASPRSDLARTVRDNVARVAGQARVYFVNPRYDEVDGTACHPDLASLPEVPDSVVLAVNPLRAATFTAEAARAGVPVVVIPGGGVVEGGEAAARMQADVHALAKATGTIIVGPNCMGVVDLTTASATYIGDLSPWLRRGGVAGIAQSGSVSDAFVQSGTRIGWSRVISCGAEVALDLSDYLAYCLDDVETHTVVLFVEGFKRPERFLALADRALELGKPILAVKVGRSEQAQVAAVAHSGSIAGEDRVTDAALRAAGVVRCGDLDELLEAAELAAGCRRMKRTVGRGRTAMVTVSTGEASLIADLAPRSGIDLPPVPNSAREQILRALPTLGYVGNPLDPWGADEAAAAYRASLDALADSAAYDVLALVHDFPFRSQAGEIDLATELAGVLAAATADRPEILPVFVSLTSGDPSPEIQETLDAAGGIPLLRGAVPASAAIARLAWWEGRRTERAASGPWRAGWRRLAADRTPFMLDETDETRRGQPAAPRPHIVVVAERESLAELSAAGIPTVQTVAVPDADAAVTAAEMLGWPVVLKLDAIGVAHKTDIGGVEVGLADVDSVRAAAERILAARRASIRSQRTGESAGSATIRGLLVQQMAPSGVELLIGMRRDRLFGPVVIVGLGGVFAEILDDVAIRLAPLATEQATAMLDELRGAAILRGVRGGQGVDRDAVARLLVVLGDAALRHPEWIQVDINPVIASPTGAIAVDALIEREA